jgi:sugar-phosphatase
MSNLGLLLVLYMIKNIEAVIFDMDGLIIDSEPYWRLAMIDVFDTVGFDATDEMCAATTGLRIDEVVDVWYVNKPWINKTKQQVCDEIIETVCNYILKKGEAMEGFFDVIKILKNQNIKLALASSSSKKIIHTVLKRLDIEKVFDVVSSGEEVSHGKPHPAVFLETAKRLQIHPTACVVFEDSIFGMVATKAARMHSIVVPEKHIYDSEKFILADIKLKSLAQFNLAMIGR